MADLTGVPVDKIQVFFVAALAILLIVGKTVSFWLSGYFSRAQIVTEQTLSIPLSTQTPVLSNSQSNIKELEDARAASTPVDNSADDNAQSDEVEDYNKSSTLSLLNPSLSPSSYDHDSEVRRLGAAVRQTVNRHVFDETILAQFLAERTMIRNGQRVSAYNLYAAYLMYAQSNNYSVLSQNQFGRLCSAAGLQRISSRRGIDYLDLVLLDEAGAQEVAQAAAA
jgi:hypothetical protein